jgi:hypothetical protein
MELFFPQPHLADLSGPFCGKYNRGQMFRTSRLVFDLVYWRYQSMSPGLWDG